MQHSDDEKDCVDIMKEKVKDAAKATKHVAEHAKDKLTGHDDSFHLKKNVRKDAEKRAHEQHEYMQQFEKRQPKRESKDSASINEEDEKEEAKLFYYKDSKDAKHKRKHPAIRQRNSQRLLEKAGNREPIVAPPPAKLMKSDNQNKGVNNAAFQEA